MDDDMRRYEDEAAELRASLSEAEVQVKKERLAREDLEAAKQEQLRVAWEQLQESNKALEDRDGQLREAHQQAERQAEEHKSKLGPLEQDLLQMQVRRSAWTI